MHHFNVFSYNSTGTIWRLAYSNRLWNSKMLRQRKNYRNSSFPISIFVSFESLKNLKGITYISSICNTGDWNRYFYINVSLRSFNKEMQKVIIWFLLFLILIASRERCRSVLQIIDLCTYVSNLIQTWERARMTMTAWQAASQLILLMPGTNTIQRTEEAEIAFLKKT